MSTFNNAILFGAGASHEAGIPLLAEFVDKMLEFADKGKAGKQVLPEGQVELLKKAVASRDALEHYHSRVWFNDRDLEDHLSLLSFNSLCGQGEGRRMNDDLVAGIASTIEICSTVRAFERLRRSSVTECDKPASFSGVVLRDCLGSGFSVTC